MTLDLCCYGITGIPLIEEGDSLSKSFLQALDKNQLQLEDGDVLVVAQKVVSKAEGRTVQLDTIEPSAQALELADQAHKDPRLVELILRECRQVVRHKPGVVIVEDVRGLVLANAGIDHSNVAQRAERKQGAADSTVLLLPTDPDASAVTLRDELQLATGRSIGVVICDSLGRAWRLGTVGIAIGCAGLPSLLDLNGEHDLFGVELRATQIGHADQIAAAASLIMGQADEAIPLVVVRGSAALTWDHRPSPATELQRAAEEDLFR